MANETSIEREIEISSEALRKIEVASRDATKELRQLNTGLRLDPSNVELTSQKFEVYEKQLSLSQQTTNQLNAEISMLDEVIRSGGDSTGAYAERVKYLESQLKETAIQTTALKGAIENKDVAMQKATGTTNNFGKTMTEFNSALQLVNRSTRGITELYSLLGGDKNSLFGKVLQTIPKITQVTMGLAAAMKLAAIATGSWQSALTLGIGAAAIVAGIVAVEKAVNKSASSVGSTSVGMSGAVSTPNISAPSVPSMPSYSSSGGGGAGNVTVQTLSEQQIKNAVYEATTRVILEQGLNDPKIIDKVTLSKREIQRWVFSGVVDPSTGLINVREVL